MNLLTSKSKIIAILFSAQLYHGGSESSGTLGEIDVYTSSPLQEDDLKHPVYFCCAKSKDKLSEKNARLELLQKYYLASKLGNISFAKPDGELSSGDWVQIYSSDTPLTMSRLILLLWRNEEDQICYKIAIRNHDMPNAPMLQLNNIPFPNKDEVELHELDQRSVDLLEQFGSKDVYNLAFMYKDDGTVSYKMQISSFCIGTRETISDRPKIIRIGRKLVLVCCPGWLLSDFARIHGGGEDHAYRGLGYYDLLKLAIEYQDPKDQKPKVAFLRVKLQEAPNCQSLGIASIEQVGDIVIDSDNLQYLERIILNNAAPLVTLMPEEQNYKWDVNEESIPEQILEGLNQGELSVLQEDDSRHGRIRLNDTGPLVTLMSEKQKQKTIPHYKWDVNEKSIPEQILEILEGLNQDELPVLQEDDLKAPVYFCSFAGDMPSITRVSQKRYVAETSNDIDAAKPDGKLEKGIPVDEYGRPLKTIQYFLLLWKDGEKVCSKFATRKQEGPNAPILQLNQDIPLPNKFDVQLHRLDAESVAAVKEIGHITRLLYIGYSDGILGRAAEIEGFCRGRKCAKQFGNDTTIIEVGDFYVLTTHPGWLNSESGNYRTFYYAGSTTIKPFAIEYYHNGKPEIRFARVILRDAKDNNSFGIASLEVGDIIIDEYNFSLLERIQFNETGPVTTLMPAEDVQPTMHNLSPLQINSEA